ncbi:MAG TPA: TIGR02678 family protein [Candidatus Dormibacteraeota bacterium]|nr:TIGR02678 family protein [Candidatus Dormibacteraeota bacterium]
MPEALRDLRRDELRQAARALVRQPLLHSTGGQDDELALVRRHEGDLKRWFHQQLGYQLVVGRDFARLHKVALRPVDLDHPATRQSGRDFDQHRYALLCLTLAVLDGADTQVVLSEVAEKIVAQAAVTEIALSSFERHSSRQAFVDVVRWLGERGVLTRVDGSEEAYVRSGDDVLYNVESRLASQVLVSSFRPTSDLNSDAPGDYPPTAEGENARTRHRIYRLLVEDAAVYLEDLTPEEREYLAFQRPAIRRELEEWLGLKLEVRSEGALSFDSENELSDRRFPGPSAIAHVALLLGYDMAIARGEERADRSQPFLDGEVDAMVAGLLEDYGRYWGKLAEEQAVDSIATDALNYLADFKLARFTDGGVVIQPAMARFAKDVRIGEEL